MEVIGKYRLVSDIRFKEAAEKEDLESLRHTCAHILAQAVKRLYPDTKCAIGQEMNVIVREPPIYRARKTRENKYGKI